MLSPLDSDPATLITILKKASGKVSEMETFSNDAKAVAAGQAQASALGGIHMGDSPENRIRAFMLAADSTNATNIQSRAIETTLRGLLSIALSVLIGAAVFATDPVSGYPPGTPTRSLSPAAPA